MRRNIRYLSLTILIVTISFASFNGIKSRGIFTPQDDKPGINNLTPIHIPTDFHVWENRLYFFMYDSLYQYDISDRMNIEYKNSLGINRIVDEIVYYKDKVYTYFTIPHFSDNCILAITRYTLDENLGFIEEKNFDGLFNGSYVFITNFLSETVAVINTNVTLATSSSSGNSTLGGILSGINETIAIGDISYLQNLRGSHYEDYYGYLLSEKDELTTYFGVFDFTNYTQPTKLGNCTISCVADTVTGLAKKDNTVYIETTNSTTIAINVTDTANPRELGNFSVQQPDFPIKIHNHYAFVNSDRKNITIYDISQINDPIKLGSIQRASYIYSFSVFDELLIISESTKVVFYDWSNPLSIFELDIDLPVTTSTFDFKAYLIIGIVCTITIIINRIVLRRKREKLLLVILIR